MRTHSSDLRFITAEGPGTAGWLGGWAGGHVRGRITPLWMCIYQLNCHVMTLGVIKEHQSISSWHGAPPPPPPPPPA